MRYTSLIPGALCSVFLILTGCARQDAFPVLEGPYLGQQPPGMVPEVFASGILNTDKMGAFCSVFSPAGDEFYFVYYQRDVEDSGGLYHMRRLNNTWTAPEKLGFASSYPENDICMSIGGERLFYRSWRPLPGHDEREEGSYIWTVTRTEDGWSEPQPVICGQEYLRAGYPSITKDHTLYYPYRPDPNVGYSDMHRSRLVEGAYTAPENLGRPVNSDYTEGDLFVAPDESYLIVSCWNRPENIGSGQGDLYIAFRKEDGSWTESINMGESINTPYGENCPQVSPDGKYFFFNSYNPDAGRGNTYWVDASILETYRPAGMN